MSQAVKNELAQTLSSKFRQHPLRTLRDEMDEMYSRFLGGFDENWLGGRLAPAADVSETETAIEVRFDLPGLKAEEIDIQMSGNSLVIKGERNEEREDKGKTYLRVERRQGTFMRTIELPCRIVEDEVAAEYKEGVLAVTLPKSEEAICKKIAVKQG